MAGTAPSFLHSAMPHIHITGEVCPWCEQPIPHEKFAEIQAKIEAKEKERTSGIEKSLRDQFSREKAQLDAKAKAEVEGAKNQAAAAIETMRAASAAEVEAMKRDAAAAAEKATQEAASRVIAARHEGKVLAETAAALTLQAAMQAKAAAEAAKAEAEQKLQVQKASHEDEMNKRIAEVREALGKDKTAAVLAEQKKTFDERQKLQEKVEGLQRQIESRTAAELGEGAEIDLFEVLKATFEEDRIRRVPKGTPGADIVHEIVIHGKAVGKIVYDSKNRNAWQNNFATKLREDMIAERADHAILSTNKFPAGFKQLHQHEGVVIACPARVIALAELLRSHVVQTHGLRFSNEEREEKTAALYAFITSEHCAQLLDSIDTLISKLLEVDVAEQRAHATVWEKRGKMLRSILKAHGDLCFQFNRIVGTADRMELDQ